MLARYGLATALVLVASVLALHVFNLSPRQFHYPDAHHYAEMGRQLARGEGFTSLQAYPFLLSWLDGKGVDTAPPWPNVTRFPLIALVYAGPFVLFGASVATVLAIGGAFHVATALATFVLGARIFGSAPAALAALLVAANVTQLVFAVSGLLETPAAFFLTATTLAVVATLDAQAAGRSRRASWLGVVLGCLLGLSFLLRYDLLALVPAAALVLWYGHGRRGLRVLAFAALGFTLVVGPWVARNLLSFGSPVAFLGIDRNVLWTKSTADPYPSGEYVPFWEQLADNPKLLDAKVENLGWPLRNWTRLFGWGLTWFGPAFLACGVVLPGLRHRALRPYVFVALAFLFRWAIFTVTHHEPRFYASFAPLFVLFAVGSAWALVERLASRVPALRVPALALLTLLLLPLAVPLPLLTGVSKAVVESAGSGAEPQLQQPEQIEADEPDAAEQPEPQLDLLLAEEPDVYALLRARTPAGSVVATSFGEGVAWYGERPSLAIEPRRIKEVQRLGVRVDGLLYATWAYRHVERALRGQGLGHEFVAVAVGPETTLWLRRRFADKRGTAPGRRGGRALRPGTSRSPSP